MAYLAPAGTPVTLHDIACGTVSAARKRAVSDHLSQAIRGLSGLTHAWGVSSGRTAMTLILQAMQAAARDPNRVEVIIPAYTCYSVPAAVARAGLRPRLCDVDPSTLGMDPERLRRCEFSRVLAVVSANLYGLPNDLVAIESICRERGVYFLDDGAQALGARIANRAVGSFGDAGLYSFDKGKVISTVQGGVIVCGPGSLAPWLEGVVAKLPNSSMAERAGNYLKLGIYALFLRPSLYPVMRMLPFTGLGHTVYELRYPMTGLSAFPSAVASILLGRLDEIGSVRRRNATALHKVFEAMIGIESIRILPEAVAAYVRYPVLVRNPAERAALIAAFDRAGIGATTSYPLSLVDVPQVRAMLPTPDLECTGARRIAATILTLPTHAYCPPDLGDRVREVVRTCIN